jgi:uncharacterized protein (TIGR02058 family)
MALKSFAIEYGLGVDLHGQDPTKAAVKAVKNAVEHISLPGMRQVAGVTDLDQQIAVEIVLGVPSPMVEMVRLDEVAAVLPFGRRSVSVTPGGLLASNGAVVPFMGDTTDQAVLVVAAITLKVEVPETVRQAGGVVLLGDQVVLRRTLKGEYLFPKGHVDPGETLEQTAVREVAEETGLEAKIIAPVGQASFSYQGDNYLVDFYLMTVTAQLPDWQQHLATDVVTVPVDEVAGLLGFESYRRLWAQAEALI